MISNARAECADARVRKELHLSRAQLQYLKTADRGAVKDWAAPSPGTLASLLRRGLLEVRHSNQGAFGSSKYFYITAAGYQALDIAGRLVVCKEADHG